MVAVVGNTGFVGSNICLMGEIDRGFNSKNIEEAYGLKPDLLIYAGLRAEKYLANNAPKKDAGLVLQAEDNIKKIEPRQLVLISTVDVFKNPVDVDEDTKIEINGLHAYGLNRYKLECWVRENYQNALIVRLPGLFGVNLKKNFIYDYINIIPSMLMQDRFEELLKRDAGLRKYYELQDNGYYKCIGLNGKDKDLLKNRFKNLGFTALNFTDSRSVFQFYPLRRLWNDIQIALRNNIRLWHAATEPVSAKELYYFLENEDFSNVLDGAPVYYNYKTKYANLFRGENGYICSKNQVLELIKGFVGEFEFEKDK